MKYRISQVMRNNLAGKADLFVEESFNPKASRGLRANDVRVEEVHIMSL